MQKDFSCKPERYALAQLPTPLRPLKRISETLPGKTIWLKQDDMTGSVVSGNKIRKLEYLLHDAVESGAKVIMTCGGLQSNHCRATAVLCAQLGLKCHLILRSDENFEVLDEERGPEYLQEITGNLLLSELCGATVSIYSARHYRQHLDLIVETLKSRYAENFQQKVYFIPTGGSNPLGLWGYIDCYNEILEQCESAGFMPDAIICASGSGGTQGGLALGAVLSKIKIDVYGMAVCDSSDYFKQKIEHDIEGWQQEFSDKISPDLCQSAQINTLDAYIGPGYGKGFDELYVTIADVARLEGVVLDPVYTGKAFYGMLQEIKHGCLSDLKNIVFVHTGGIYGVFPFARELTHIQSNYSL